MSRSPKPGSGGSRGESRPWSTAQRLAAGLGLTAGVAACAAGAGAVSAQSTTPGDATRAPVVDLVLPVLDLDLRTSSLDNSIRRSDTSKAIRVTLDADVLFAFNRAQLSGRAANRIAQTATDIKRLKPAAVTIVGHSDNKGSTAYNERLSKRRADAVRRALAARLGADRPRLVATGKGETDPVARNTKRNGEDNPRGRALNRRVEIGIPKR